MIVPRSRVVAAVSTCLIGAALAVPAPAAATTSPGALATSKANAVSYVKGLQAADGSFVSSGLSNEWAFSALAASGVAAVDVTPSGNTAKNARTVYQGQVAASTWPGTSPVVTDYERGLLNTYAAGIDPARVSANRNLVADVLSYWQTASPGYFGPPANFNGTVFALLALAGAKTQAGVQRVPQSLLNSAISVVRANEHTDGGWDFGQATTQSAKSATSDIDMTGATIASLCASGVANTDTAVVAGKNFLKSKLVAASGAFNSSFGSNADSNGWAVSGLNACGFPSQTGDFLTASGKTPIDYLETLQVNPGGGFKYQASSSAATAYPTIDALRAIAGGGFTAAPPTPTTTGAPRWVAATSFVNGSTSRLGVVVDDGVAADLKAGSVPLTTTAATSTLGAVLDAANGSTPSGLVTSSAPGGTSGAITTINGVSNAGGKTWKVVIDGATPVGADRSTVIHLGDTISLQYS